MLARTHVRTHSRTRLPHRIMFCFMFFIRCFVLFFVLCLNVPHFLHVCVCFCPCVDRLNDRNWSPLPFLYLALSHSLRDRCERNHFRFPCLCVPLRSVHGSSHSSNPIAIPFALDVDFLPNLSSLESSQKNAALVEFICIIFCNYASIYASNGNLQDNGRKKGNGYTLHG